MRLLIGIHPTHRSLMPFEPTDLKSLQGRHNYHLMTSNEVMQEMSAFKVAAKNAQDARAQAIGMHKGTSLALKAKVVEHEFVLRSSGSSFEIFASA